MNKNNIFNNDNRYTSLMEITSNNINLDMIEKKEIEFLINSAKLKLKELQQHENQQTIIDSNTQSYKKKKRRKGQEKDKKNITVNNNNNYINYNNNDEHRQIYSSSNDSSISHVWETKQKYNLGTEGIMFMTQKLYIKNFNNRTCYKIFINYKQKFENYMVIEQIFPDISIIYHEIYNFIIAFIVEKKILFSQKKNPTLLLANNITTTRMLFGNNNDNNEYCSITTLPQFIVKNNKIPKKTSGVDNQRFNLFYYDFLDFATIDLNYGINNTRYNNLNFSNNNKNTLNQTLISDNTTITNYNYNDDDDNNDDDYWNIKKNSTFYEKHFVDGKIINLQFYWIEGFLQEIRIFDFKTSCKFLEKAK